MNNNTFNILAVIWFILLIYLGIISAETNIPYVIYYFFGTPIILIIGVKLYFSLGFDERNEKRKHEKFLKDKAEKDRIVKIKIELERKKKQEEWDNLTDKEKEKIITQKKKADQERRDKIYNEIRESIKAENDAKKLAEENKLKEAQKKVQEEENERIKQLKLIEEKEEKEKEIAEKRIALLKEQKEKKEKEQKELIKRKILENERKKQLESEAIQELLEAGLIDNNYYSGKNIRESIPTEVKVAVWQRDKERCVNCYSNSNLEFDHIIPVSKGGANSIKNIQLLCRNCNRTKSNKIM
ncbi:HNH endonuclease [Flavobacterium sp.]|uniref:HNH endonuclease n=1 Tax=Flavobacterium sp. TaxID=239 RepID=UPI0022C80AB8|nr:HNH endonuclease [Flavobacterium sp.]MCZ8089038.1 HNH endonuclease [Flavobacterium sp.]